ncbi:MAG: alpha/beta hydrolase [Brevinematales bacterium]|jgi:pimeloyl-ACP methyl ester carboxylesterase
MEVRYAAVNGLKIYYIEENSAEAYKSKEAVLFVHGFFSRGQSFDKLMKGLSGKYRSYAPDLPGSGASEDPKYFKPGFRQFAEFLRDFCSELGLPRVILAGDSMGGAISIMTAVMYPELVSKIILIDTISYNKKPEFSARLAMSPLIGSFIFRRLFKWEMFKSLFMKDIYADNSKIDQAELFENYKLFDNPSRREFSYRMMRSVTNSSEVEKIIRDVKQPVLIIWGEKDRMLPLANAERLKKDLKNAILTVIPGAGHASFDENPEMAIDAIIKFIG